MTNRLAPGLPHSWWSVAEKALGRSRGLALYYRVGRRRPIRDEHGRWWRDAQGRTALEAFAALPLGVMYQRLVDGDAAWRTVGDDATRAAITEADPEREPRRWLAAFAELEAFVDTFGPLGLDWARTYWVHNTPAEEALNPPQWQPATSVTPPEDDPPVEPTVAPMAREWNVVFRSSGFGLPEVREVRTFRGRPWKERIHLGDEGLLRDVLGPGSVGPVWLQQDDLRRALALVEALGEGHPNPHMIREAAGRLPGIGVFDVTEHDRDPVDLYWRDAMRPQRDPAGGRWFPHSEHPSRVDWITAGRLTLADYLSAQLAWSSVGAGLDVHGQIRTRWTVQSLLDVIYLQLLEHVEERLDFGIGWCGNCGGPILRTRRSERTQNRAHHGCAALLRKRRERARKRATAAGEGLP